MTDPARTTKDELLPCPFCGKQPHERRARINPHAECRTDGCFGRQMSSVNLDDTKSVSAWNTRADAADALRAQVAALQAENERLLNDMREIANVIEPHWKGAGLELQAKWIIDEIIDIATIQTNESERADKAEAKVAALQEENERLAHEVLGWEVCKGHWTGTITLLESELAAVQAKLAVPVPSDVQTALLLLRAALKPNTARNWAEGAVQNAINLLESLARDNAALRTQAEALERERDDVDAEKATRQSMEDFGPGCKLYRRIEWYLRANDNNALLDAHKVITLIAEKL